MRHKEVCHEHVRIDQLRPCRPFPQNLPRRRGSDRGGPRPWGAHPIRIRRRGTRQGDRGGGSRRHRRRPGRPVWREHRGRRCGRHPQVVRRQPRRHRAVRRGGEPRHPDRLEPLRHADPLRLCEQPRRAAGVRELRGQRGRHAVHVPPAPGRDVPQRAAGHLARLQVRVGAHLPRGLQARPLGGRLQDRAGQRSDRDDGGHGGQARRRMSRRLHARREPGLPVRRV